MAVSESSTGSTVVKAVRWRRSELAAVEAAAVAVGLPLNAWVRRSCRLALEFEAAEVAMVEREARGGALAGLGDGG